MDLIGEFRKWYVEFGSIIPEDACQEMVRKVHVTRQFDDSLFFSEAEFLFQVNPDAFNKESAPRVQYPRITGDRIRCRGGQPDPY